MSTNHDLYLDLVAALAVGALDPADRHVLEQHMDAGCAECEAFLSELSTPVEALARSAGPARPGKGLKARVLVQIASARSSKDERRAVRAPALEPSRLGLPPWTWAVAAVLLVAAGLGWWQVSLLARRVDDLEAEVARQEPKVSPDAALARFVAEHPGARSLVLEATPDGETGRTARVAYDAASRRAVVSFEGFRAPAGEDFELWTIRGGKPLSEGVVRVDEDGRGVMVIENTGDPSSLAAFAVSSEAAGGSKDRQTPRKVAYVAPVP